MHCLYIIGQWYVAIEAYQSLQVNVYMLEHAQKLVVNNKRGPKYVGLVYNKH